jgi:hypothetical protein
MKSKNSVLFFFPLIVLLFTSFTPQLRKSPETSREIITQLLHEIDHLETLKWTLKVIERIDGKPKNYGSSVKLKINPRKIYINIKGTELLWIAGTNGGKALVHPNSFPYFNLNLDPMGSLMRDGQHHTLHEMGFTYMGQIIRQFEIKAQKNFDQVFLNEGEEIHNNVKCYKIRISNPGFGFFNYTVKKNETITSIARRYFVNEYMILENNPKFDDYDDIDEGDILKIPNSYAKTVLLFVDQIHYMPVGIRVEDDKGLFEQYDYFSLEVNPKIKDEEFSRNYKEYNF